MVNNMCVIRSMWDTRSFSRYVDCASKSCLRKRRLFIGVCLAPIYPGCASTNSRILEIEFSDARVVQRKIVPNGFKRQKIIPRYLSKNELQILCPLETSYRHLLTIAQYIPVSVRMQSSTVSSADKEDSKVVHNYDLPKQIRGFLPYSLIFVTSWYKGPMKQWSKQFRNKILVSKIIPTKLLSAESTLGKPLYCNIF